MESLVSIIMPAYNASAYILEALQSVKDQTIENWECIIVNDGSTDTTEELIQSFIENDKRFKLITTTNSGVSIARNTAVSYSKGKYLFPLDSDNYLHKDCIKQCLSEFEKNPGLKLVYTEAELFGDEKGIWNLPDFDYQTMLRYNMVDNTAMFLKEDFIKVGGYRINMTDGLEDWDFFIALLENYSKDQVLKIKKRLYYYRSYLTSRRSSLVNSDRFKVMLDNIVYNNFHIYRKYFPDIHSRITKYDFHVTMLEKPPVKLLTKTLIKLSYLKKAIEKI